ncbi:MAG: DUF4149 domain-containing protein [Pseudomonadota bacterium]
MLEPIALLATATLFGGMLLYSFGFAPFVFTSLPAEDAGRLIRRAFPHYYAFVILASGLATLLVLAVDPLSAGLLAASAALGIWARQGLMPAINAARDAGEKSKFGRLHGLSVVINFIQLGAIGFALVRFL